MQADGRLVAGGSGFIDGGDGVRGGDDDLYVLARLSAGDIDEPRPDNLPDGTTNSTVFDHNGNLHVAYHDSAAKNLKYRFRDFSGRWGPIQTVDAGKFTGDEPGVAVDSKGNVAVAYFDGFAADLKLARRQANGQWSIQTVDSRGGVGLYPDLKFDRNDRPWIAYCHKSRGNLRLAGLVDGAWKIETVDASGDAGRTPSLAENTSIGRWSMVYTAADKTVRAGSGSNAPFVAAYQSATGGGRFLSAAQRPFGELAMLTYLDDASGDLIVRRG